MSVWGQERKEGRKRRVLAALRSADVVVWRVCEVVWRVCGGVESVCGGVEAGSSLLRVMGNSGREDLSGVGADQTGREDANEKEV